MKLRKMLALMLALLMAAALLASCGTTTPTDSGKQEEAAAPAEDSGKEEEPAAEADAGDVPVVTLVMPNAGGNDENLPKVIDAMNEILVKEVGAKIDIKMFSFGEYSQRLTTMLTEAGSVDIFYVGGGPSTYVDKDQLYDITDLFEASDDSFKNLFKEAYVEANKVDGRLYSLTSLINFSNEFLCRCNRELYESLGYEIDDNKIWTVDEIFDLCRACKEKYPDVYPIVPQSTNVTVACINWDSLGDSYHIGTVADFGTTGQVVSITEVPEFIEFARKMHSAYEEGLMMKDYLSNTESWSTMCANGKALLAFDAGAAPNGLVTDDTTVISLTIVPNWSASNCAVRLGYGINSTSKNPEKAFEVLKQLYYNEDVLNLLTWGIEGENYQLKDINGTGVMHAVDPDGIAQENNTYTLGYVAKWITPNMFDSYLGASQTDNWKEAYSEYEQGAVISGCMGCVFDSTKVSDAYSACINVYQKYYAAIIGGAWDVDEYLEEFASELKAAGEDEVIAEKQAQLDAVLGK